jgi:hypothetical protein
MAQSRHALLDCALAVGLLGSTNIVIDKTIRATITSHLVLNIFRIVIHPFRLEG